MRFASSVTRAPPCPVVITLGLLNEKLPMSPKVPRCRPRQREPSACAASSTRNSPCRRASATARAMSGARPLKLTSMMAFVRSVTWRSACSRSRQRLDGSTSTNTGVAPARTTVLAEAIMVRSGTSTSWPAPTPSAASAAKRLTVPLETMATWRAPT